MDYKLKTKSVDRDFWNIMKGIGIILVVVGHFCSPVIRFIYLFHLPLFFFVSGYLYDEEKYGDNPYLNVAARMRSSWMKYVFLFWILILMHNFFIEHKMVWLFGGIYSFADIVSKMTDALFGMGEEAFGVTLWYVPAAVIASCILGFIVTFSRKVYKMTNSLVLKYLVQAVSVAACTVPGYYFMDEEIRMHASMQVSLVVMPFLWGGYLLRTFQIDYTKFLKIIPAIICGVIVYIVSREYRLELAMQSVYPCMHLVAFLGIYMSMYVAKIVQKTSKFKNLFVTYGRASFWIMFAHLVLCRLFDWVYINIFHKENFEELYYVIRPAVYAKQFWPIYLVLGLGVSLLMFVVYEKCKKRIKAWATEKNR